MKQKLQTLLKLDDKLVDFLKRNNESVPVNSMKAIDLLKRNNIDIFKLNDEYGLFDESEKSLLETLNTEVKYEGYIKQQNDEIEKLKNQEEIKLPEDIDYSQIKGLRIEAQQKLNKVRPLTLGHATRISGVSPADITVLSIYLKAKK